MRKVITTDRFGYKCAWLVKDEDSDELADQGIPLSPPCLGLIEWEEVKRDLNNILVDRGLFTWMDVQRSQNGVTTAVLAAMRKRVITLYKVREVKTDDRSN